MIVHVLFLPLPRQLQYIVHVYNGILVRMDYTIIVSAATVLFSCRGNLAVTQSSLLAGLSTYVTEYAHKGVTEVEQL